MNLRVFFFLCFHGFCKTNQSPSGFSGSSWNGLDDLRFRNAAHVRVQGEPIGLFGKFKRRVFLWQNITFCLSKHAGWHNLMTFRAWLNSMCQIMSLPTLNVKESTVKSKMIKSIKAKSNNRKLVALISPVWGNDQVAVHFSVAVLWS